MQAASLDDSRYRSVHSEPLDYAEDSDEDIAQPKEGEKVAIRRSTLTVLVRICCYLVPVGISFAILQLSFRRIYWRGTGYSGDGNLSKYSINEVLNVLQLVAKAHEILIVLSLSHIVLYWLRHQLVSYGGLSFGLLTSAYQVTLGGAPFSSGFWHACKNLFRKEAFNKQALSLVLLLLLVTGLGLAVGPASAIAVIPRLDWWVHRDLFVLYQNPEKTSQDFKMYIPKQLFPHTLDSLSLPGTYCLNSTLDVNSSCPFAGYSNLLTVFNVTGSTDPDNITLADGTGLGRRMASRVNLGSINGNLNELGTRTVGGTYTWVQNQVLANYMSLGWDSGVADGDPFIVEAKPLQGAPMNPFVNVTCQMAPSSEYIRNLSDLNWPYGNTPLASSFEPAGPFHEGTFDIRDLWGKDTLSSSNQTLFEWKEFFEDSDDPILAAFVFSPPATRMDSRNVSMCKIDVRYDQTGMWFISDQTPAVSSNFTFDLQFEKHNRNYDKVYPTVRVRKDWADSLNAATRNSPGVMTDLIGEAMRKFHQDSAGTSVLALSKILSMAVADGVSRLGAEYNANVGQKVGPDSCGNDNYAVGGSNITICHGGWCSQGWVVNKCLGPAILNGTEAEYADSLLIQEYGSITNASGNLMRSFPAPSDIDYSWTQVSFPIKRYGYGWSFDTKAVRVATAILLLHAVAILIHCAALLCTRISYTFSGSLGDFVALALSSHAPVSFKSASVGIARGSTWAQPTAVREVGEEFGTGKLAFVIGEDLREDDKKSMTHRKPVIGRGYE